MIPSIRHIHEHFSLLSWAYRLLDAASVAGGLALALALPNQPLFDPYVAGFASLAIYFLFAEVSGVYRSWRGSNEGHEATCMMLTWFGTAAAMSVLGLWIPALASISRPCLTVWFFSTPVFIIAIHSTARMVQHALHARGFNTRNFAIVGCNELGFQLARNVSRSPELGLRLVGFYDDRPAHRRSNIPEGLGTLSGDIAQLVSDSKRGQVDRIYIAFPMRAEERIKRVLAQLSDSTASVYIVPDFFVFQMLHSRWSNVGGLPAVSVFESPFYGVDGVLKRTTDLVLSAILLAMLALPMTIIAIAIKVTSPGPVFFRQRRYGLDGREIWVWKFRSMRVMENGAKVTQATKNDPRITPLGNFLRKSSLDELPQLFNVIEGTMSLVGPRPHASAHNEQYRNVIEGYMLRHKVKPGITGFAQVSGYRGETDTLDKMAKRVEFDHRYIREWSYWLDWQILFRTISVVLDRKNAY